MKKSKKISIYILLIISIFIFNGQHVYAMEHNVVIDTFQAIMDTQCSIYIMAVIVHPIVKP